MKLAIAQDKLSQALSLVNKAVSTRSLNLVLTHIRVQVGKEQTTLTGSDGDFTIEHALEVKGEKEGALLVPARLFVDLVSRLPKGEVTLERADGKLRIVCGAADYQLNILPDENFPTLPLFEEGKLAQVTAGSFKKALNRTSFCALKDPSGTTSHYTHAILIKFIEESLDLVGTDGHRLAFEQLDNPNPEIKEKSLLVPTVIVDELKKALPAEEDAPVEIYYLSNQVFFRFDKTAFAGSLFDIKFPDYRKVIPGDTKSIINLNRAGLRDALSRVQTVQREPRGGHRRRGASAHQGRPVRRGEPAEAGGTRRTWLHLYRDADSHGLSRPDGAAELDDSHKLPSELLSFPTEG
ncbi:MAG: DNA polymerase III subunit beta [Planctomycetales bacterium 4484_113]|nr:MAG: DNA polymerase III subunit beta [Planctomycetales bacterium 4484_113]